MNWLNVTNLLITLIFLLLPYRNIGSHNLETTSDSGVLQLVLVGSTTDEHHGFFVDLLTQYKEASGHKIRIEVRNNCENLTTEMGELQGIVITPMTYSLQWWYDNYTVDDLSELVSSNLQRDIIPSFRDNTCKVGEKLAALPLSRTKLHLYYNLEHITSITDNSCIPINAQKEFERLLENCKTHYSDNNILFFGDEQFDWIFESFLMLRGKNLITNNNKVNFATTEAIQLLQWWKESYDAGILHIGTSWLSANNAFCDQKHPSLMACMPSDAYMSVYNKKSIQEFEMGKIPRNITTQTAIGGSNLSLTNNLPQYKEEVALDFIRYLYSAEIQKNMAVRLGAHPVTKSAWKDQRLKDIFTKHNLGTADNLIATTKPRMTTIAQTEVTQELRDAIFQVFIHDENIASALQRATENANRILTEKKARRR